MKINKIRPKFHFLRKVEIKMTYLVFVVFFFLLSLFLLSHLQAVLSMFKILSCSFFLLLVQRKILNVDKTAPKWN